MISLHFSHLNFSGKKQSAKYVIFIELIKLIEEFFTPGISWWIEAKSYTLKVICYYGKKWNTGIVEYWKDGTFSKAKPYKWIVW